MLKIPSPKSLISNDDKFDEIFSRYFIIWMKLHPVIIVLSLLGIKVFNPLLFYGWVFLWLIGFVLNYGLILAIGVLHQFKTGFEHGVGPVLLAAFFYWVHYELFTSFDILDIFTTEFLLSLMF